MQKVANDNGYPKSFVDKIVHRHSLNAKRNKSTTLFSQNKRNDDGVVKKRVALSYIPSITDKLTNTFSHFDMQIVYKNENKLKCLLGSTKDKTPSTQKSGIYCIQCAVCDKEYIGQTKRPIEKRYTEHTYHTNTGAAYRSAVALHSLENEHLSGPRNLRLLKQVNDERRLDAYESIFIRKSTNNMNLDKGNIESMLFDLL